MLLIAEFAWGRLPKPLIHSGSIEEDRKQFAPRKNQQNLEETSESIRRQDRSSFRVWQLIGCRGDSIRGWSLPRAHRPDRTAAQSRPRLLDRPESNTTSKCCRQRSELHRLRKTPATTRRVSDRATSNEHVCHRTSTTARCADSRLRGNAKGLGPDR